MNNKKLFVITILLLSIVILILANLTLFKPVQEKEGEDEGLLKIGVSIYNGNDTYISEAKSRIEDASKKYEMETGKKIRIDFFDAQESQAMQNSEVSKFISLGYDVLAINMVDRTEASSMIDKAMQAGIPLVFFNREPVAEDLQKWEKTYYVGYDASLSAKLQAEIVLDIYKKNPELIDINGDGIVQYVMFEGESRHQDSLIRTEKSVSTLKQGGMALEKLAGDIGDWKRTQAAAIMTGYLEEFGSQIELVICNNDDMALGVIDELERSGKNFRNVVGIDATPYGIEAVKNGKMLGTVDISAKQLGETVFDVSLLLAEDADLEKSVTLTDNKYIWLPQKVVLP